MTWSDLANSAAGRPALVLGKGPSLDAWLDAGCPVPDNAMIIGINDVCISLPPHIRAEWSVSTHRSDSWASLPTQWLCSIPACHPSPLTWANADWSPPQIASHTFLHIIGLDAARDLNRHQISQTHILANHSSSSQPAIHFAWYIGCTSLILVGIDGPGPNAQHYGARRHNDYIAPPHPGLQTYSGMKRDTEKIATILYGQQWSHWGPP